MFLSPPRNNERRFSFFLFLAIPRRPILLTFMGKKGLRELPPGSVRSSMLPGEGFGFLFKGRWPRSCHSEEPSSHLLFSTTPFEAFPVRETYFFYCPYTSRRFRFPTVSPKFAEPPSPVSSPPRNQLPHTYFSGYHVAVFKEVLLSSRQSKRWYLSEYPCVPSRSGTFFPGLFHYPMCEVLFAL